MENLFNISQGLILNDYKTALALQSEEVLLNSNNKRGAVIACETGVSVQVAELKKPPHHLVLGCSVVQNFDTDLLYLKNKKSKNWIRVPSFGKMIPVLKCCCCMSKETQPQSVW